MEWTSKKEPHMIKNLNVGESYTLIEETSPQGYKIAESIEFKIEDTGATNMLLCMMNIFQ